MRGRLGVGLVAVWLGCGGAGAGKETGAGESSGGGSTGAAPVSTGADGANTGPVSGSSGEAPTGGETGMGEAGMGESGGSETGASSSTGVEGCPERAQVGVWVWQPDTAKDPAKAAELLAFAVEQGVTHVYLESESLLAEAPERLAGFIAEADAQCVAVELLFGDAEWARTENHALALALVEDSLDFVDALAGPRPVGLHFDVEPHGLPDWDAMQGVYAGQYLDLLAVMAMNLEGSELPLTVDIAFWYDGVMVERDGEVRPLNELVQDRVDRVVIMDYRDHAEPPDGILDNAEVEVAYAEQIGRGVRVAVESTCGLEPEKVTFCEEGAIAMILALELAKVTFDGSASWHGVAVHDYEAWSVLMD